MGRNKDRIKRIDEFLIENYSFCGAVYCADYLDESLQYIRNRVGYLKLKLEDGRRRKTDNKIISLSDEIAMIQALQDKIKDLREINKDLRRENIILIHENMELRKNM